MQANKKKIKQNKNENKTMKKNKVRALLLYLIPTLIVFIVHLFSTEYVIWANKKAIRDAFLRKYKSQSSVLRLKTPKNNENLKLANKNSKDAEWTMAATLRQQEGFILFIQHLAKLCISRNAVFFFCNVSLIPTCAHAFTPLHTLHTHASFIFESSCCKPVKCVQYVFVTYHVLLCICVTKKMHAL